jgi:hypothetical protein
MGGSFFTFDEETDRRHGVLDQNRLNLIGAIDIRKSGKEENMTLELGYIDFVSQADVIKKADR